MRFWPIKIILITAIVCHSSAALAKGYDFIFNVKNSTYAQAPSMVHSTPYTSTASWRIGMRATFLPDFIKGDGELVYGGFSKNSTAEYSGWDRYLLKLGASGKQDALGFGVNFYSVGQRYEGKFNSKYRHKKGYTGYESWLSWNFDKLQVKSKYSEYWTKNSNQLSKASWWYEVKTSYPLTTTPFTELAMSYRLGEKSSINLSDHIKTYEGRLNSLKARFHFSHVYLNSSLELIQSNSQNNLNNQRGFRQEMVYINSTLFPKNLLSITSSYRLSANTNSSLTYETKLNKQESSLGFIYKSAEFPGKLKFTSAYNNFRSDNGLVELDIVKFDVRFDLHAIESISGLKTSWAMDLRYKDIKDKINPSSSLSDWSLNLLWQLPIS